MLKTYFRYEGARTVQIKVQVIDRCAHFNVKLLHYNLLQEKPAQGFFQAFTWQNAFRKFERSHR